MNHLLKVLAPSVVVAIVNVIAVPAFADTNLLLDPGFENGGLDWTFAPINGAGCGVGPDVGITGEAHSGTRSAYKNCFGSGSGTIEQSVNTVPGHTYQFEVWVASNGFQVGSLSINFADNGFTTGLPSGVMPYSLTSFSTVATNTLSTVRIGGTLSNGTLFFDDFSVVDITPVQEPAANMLFVAGLSAIGFIGWRLRV